MKATIITHTGKSHESDFLSVCFLLASLPHKEIEVHRRQPSEEEMNDPHCFIVDIGGKWNSTTSNFDHRTNIKGPDPLCSFSLVLKCFNMYEAAKEAWPWLTYIEHKDVRGIEAATTYYFKNMKAKDTLPMSTSNIERSMMDAFSKVEVLKEDHDCLYQIMKDVIGRDMVNELKRIKERVSILRKFVKYGDIEQVKPKLRYADARDVPVLNNSEMGYYTLFREDGEDVDILFSNDPNPKAEGNIILRWEDPTTPNIVPSIDFREVDGDFRVSYVHYASKRDDFGEYVLDESDPENGKFIKTRKQINLEDMKQLVHWAASGPTF